MSNRWVRFRRNLFLSVAVAVVVSCGSPPPEPTLTPSQTVRPSQTASPTRTDTPIPSETPTITPTPSATLSPTPSDTPTPEPLTALAVGNVNCRWGPGTAYVGKTTFNDGQVALVEARDFSSQWVWIQPPDFNQHCWVSVSAVTLNGDIKLVGAMPPNLPANGDVPVPAGISAVRNGGSVTISWSAVADAPEVGYLLEVTTCINGYLIDGAYATENTSITLQDGTNCSGSSLGVLRSKNKLGYSAPVTIPWP